MEQNLLSKGLAKLEYAERVQLAARVKRLTGEIEELWPFFLRTADVDTLWAEIGQGTEPPAMSAIRLSMLAL